MRPNPSLRPEPEPEAESPPLEPEPEPQPEPESETLLQGEWQLPAGTEGYRCVCATLADEVIVSAIEPIAPARPPTARPR